MTTKLLASGIYRLISRRPEMAPQILAEFKGVLEAKNLLTWWRPTLSHLLVLAKRQQVKESAIIKSSHDLDQSSILMIKKLIDLDPAGPVVTEIEPELVGGFTVSHNYRLYDASLRQVLIDLKTALS